MLDFYNNEVKKQDHLQKILDEKFPKENCDQLKALITAQKELLNTLISKIHDPLSLSFPTSDDELEGINQYCDNYMQQQQLIVALDNPELSLHHFRITPRVIKETVSPRAIFSKIENPTEISGSPATFFSLPPALPQLSKKRSLEDNKASKQEPEKKRSKTNEPNTSLRRSSRIRASRIAKQNNDVSPQNDTKAKIPTNKTANTFFAPTPQARTMPLPTVVSNPTQRCHTAPAAQPSTLFRQYNLHYIHELQRQIEMLNQQLASRRQPEKEVTHNSNAFTYN